MNHLNSTSVIAVIPCLNTEQYIKDVVTRTRQYVDRVIVIDDGSTDSTAKVASEAGATVISHEKNLGYGAAIKSGFAAARQHSATILITIDGDGQHNPDEIPRLIQPILDNKADLVIGSRFISNENSVPAYRQIGIKVITWLFNIGAKAKVTDAQSGFRAYGKKAVDLEFHESGMSNSIEILEKARRSNFIIREVPATCKYHHSSLNFAAFKHGILISLAVIKLRTGRK